MHSGVAKQSQDGSARGKRGAGMQSSRNADHKARGSSKRTAKYSTYHNSSKSKGMGKGSY